MSNFCNWNATDTEYTGVDVAKAMLDISAHESFMTLDDVTRMQKKKRLDQFTEVLIKRILII